MDNSYYMHEAIKQAQIASKHNEVPIGCVIVYKDKIIAKAHNLREKHQQTSSHAEMLAIKKACKKLKSWRLEDCTIYVTVEPCPMCSGAILQSRIKKICFGAYEPKFGSCGSVFNLFEYKYNHTCIVEGGILESECKKLLQDFFANLRKERKYDKSK